MPEPKTVRKSVVVEVDGQNVEVRQFSALKFYRLLDRHGAYKAGRIGLADLYVPTVADALDQTDWDPPGPAVGILEAGKRSPDFVAAVYKAVMEINDFDGFVAKLEEDSKKKSPEG